MLEHGLLRISVHLHIAFAAEPHQAEGATGACGEEEVCAPQ
jgi:hypothetical protein